MEKKLIIKVDSGITLKEINDLEEMIKSTLGKRYINMEWKVA